MFPEAITYAYDISEKARKQTLAIAIANSVFERVKIKEECRKDHLFALNPSAKGLTISDCEGYEIELFDVEVANHLKNYNLVIKMHDRPHKDF